MNKPINVATKDTTEISKNEVCGTKLAFFSKSKFQITTKLQQIIGQKRSTYVSSKAVANGIATASVDFSTSPTGEGVLSVSKSRPHYRLYPLTQEGFLMLRTSPPPDQPTTLVADGLRPNTDGTTSNVPAHPL